jgi:hypothetical protein
MGLIEITSFAALRAFIPLLVKVYKELDGYWEEGIGVEDFVALLSEQFYTPGRRFYGLQINGELCYFISVVQRSTTECHFWLFYVNKNKREHTTRLVNTLFSELRRGGYKELTFTTTRMTRSYDRWVAKFGAQKKSINYKLDL